MSALPNIDMYLGASLTEESERSILKSLVAGFGKSGVPAVILVNFHIDGRQVDCVVATAHDAWLVEVKSSALLVRGAINGDWERLLPTGQWKTYPNAYQQALDAKNRLRDVMASRGLIDRFYPAGAVVFTDRSAISPELTRGDFKVSVTQSHLFRPWAQTEDRSPWTLDQWRSFAIGLGLAKVSPREAASSSELASRLSALRLLTTAAKADYAKDGDRWIAESETARADLLEALQQPPGCRVTGPTGCGKSLIARWFAADRAAKGECALVLQCKDYAGSWARLLNREGALLCDLPIRELYAALRAAEAPSYLILDGMNELAGDRSQAVRAAAALCRRFGLRLIVTDQVDEEPGLAGLGWLRIHPPDSDLKAQIAARAGSRVTKSQLALLDAVTSGFEAAIVGEIGAVAEPMSRQLLIDQYIRRRLGDHARDGAAGLRRFALQLQSDLAFSASETAFDELMLGDQIGASTCSAMFDADLLVRRSGRISFSHEMLFQANVAHAFASQANKIGEPFAKLLGSPLFERIAGDVLAVVEDDDTCRRILAASTNAELLHAAASGDFGDLARAEAQRLLDEVLDTVAAEIDGLRLIILDGERPKLDWEEQSLRGWSHEEGARLGAIGHAVDDGNYIGLYLDLCARMDARLLAERGRLAESCKTHGIRNPRTQGFWLAYLQFGRANGFSILARNCQSSFRRSAARRHALELNVATATSGQLYFYLERRHDLVGDDQADRFAQELIAIFRDRYRYEPYHVQLAIMQAAGFSRGADQAHIDELIEAIQMVLDEPGPDTGGVDALKFLGALDESAEDSRPQIEVEVAAVIGPADGPQVCATALSLSNAMFDHPFDYVYYDVIHALPERDRRLFLRRALDADERRQSWNLGYLAREVAMFADPGDMFRIQHLAELPDPSNGMPQSEWEAFVIATRYLGRMGLPLPPSTASTPAGHCIETLRTLVHAFEAGAQAKVRAVWRELNGMSPGLVIGCLSEMDAALGEGSWRRMGPQWPQFFIASEFPERCLRFARGFLDSGEQAEHHHRAWERERPAQYAFQCIESHGDRSDVARLRRLALTGRFSRMALNALAVRDRA